MSLRRHRRRSGTGFALGVERLESRQALAVDAAALPVATAAALPARQVEYLTRGVNAISTGSSRVYVNWRMLGTDPAAIAFNVYRSTDGGTPVKRNTSP
ncbi:MAG: hypothetical protein KGR24_04990, partial [Planctomycetes bacterium]|nr:hypothetical protein [Planctomycetota bacterium]